MKNKSLLLAIGAVALAITANIQLQKSTVDESEQPMLTNDIAAEYVQLTLALGEHEAGYIDAYYGPEKWQEKVKGSSKSLQEIVQEAKLLIHHLSFQIADKNKLDEIEQLRLSYLDAQLNALIARTKMNIGDVKYSFDEETLALFNTEAPKKEWAEFQQAIDQLDQLLPGEQDILVKLEAFRKQFIIPQDKLKPVFDVAIKECRDRTKQHVELLANENFELEFVTDKPWSGYNWYKGDAYSLIQVNVELPIDISRAIDLGCHEGYPGHHTYNGLLEANLYKKRGWVEFSVYPLFSPQSLIAEGSANYGIEMAFPGDEKIKFEQEVLFPLAGLDANKAKQYAAVNKLVAKVSYAGNEVGRQYQNGEIDAVRAAQLLEQYALMSPAKAKQRVKFMDTYGSYIINYNWGKDLVKNWVEKGESLSFDEKWERFSKLLSTPRLPSTLN